MTDATPQAALLSDDYDDPDVPECHWCHGDGMDPMTDYLFPCPYCQGEQRP